MCYRHAIQGAHRRGGLRWLAVGGTQSNPNGERNSGVGGWRLAVLNQTLTGRETQATQAYVPCIAKAFGEGVGGYH